MNEGCACEDGASCEDNSSEDSRKTHDEISMEKKVADNFQKVMRA